MLPNRGRRARYDLWLVRPTTAFVHARVVPQLTSGHDRIDAGILPLGSLVADVIASHAGGEQFWSQRGL